jgi:hypothetical protein
MGLPAAYGTVTAEEITFIRFTYKAGQELFLKRQKKVAK